MRLFDEICDGDNTRHWREPPKPRVPSLKWGNTQEPKKAYLKKNEAKHQNLKIIETGLMIHNEY
jgi:hypothetical protein